MLRTTILRLLVLFWATSHESHEHDPEFDVFKDKQEEEERMNEEDDEDEESSRQEKKDDEEDEDIYSDDMRAV